MAGVASGQPGVEAEKQIPCSRMAAQGIEIRL